MAEEQDWQPISTAKKDGSMLQMYCPGACPITNGVVIGGWLERLSIWELLPYGTRQPVALYPSMWKPLTAPPEA